MDARRFERVAAQGRDALARGDHADASRLLAGALGLWRGPALQDMRYEPFAAGEAERLEELRLTCLGERIEADLALGRHAELVAELQALVGEHPLRESLRAQLMLALYRGGRQADALAAYRDARRVLADELGLDLSPELQALERDILRHRVGPLAGPAQRPGGARSSASRWTSSRASAGRRSIPRCCKTYWNAATTPWRRLRFATAILPASCAGTA